MALSSCTSCLFEKSNFSLYLCESCIEEQSKDSNSNLMCEDCIVPHIRKNHTVIDSKGNKPLICSAHSFVFSEYCKTCDVLFCLKCIANHRKHDYESIDDKASEIKAKVFDLLTDLEIQEKPLQLKNTTNSELVQKKTRTMQKKLALLYKITATD